MSSRLIKICMRPRCKNKFDESSPYFEGESCSCGAPLLVKKEDILEVNNVFGEVPQSTPENVFSSDSSNETYANNKVERLITNASSNSLNTDNNNDTVTTNEEEKEKIFVLDHSGGIHFDFTKEEQLTDEDRVIIYLDGYIYKEIPLEYDETIFGRQNSLFEPDVDLSDIDYARKTSRKHLMIYRSGDKYFARNLTEKNSVHIERTSLKDGEDIELEDGNLIILSKSVVMVFKEGR